MSFLALYAPTSRRPVRRRLVLLERRARAVYRLERVSGRDFLVWRRLDCAGDSVRPSPEHRPARADRMLFAVSLPFGWERRGCAGRVLFFVFSRRRVSCRWPVVRVLMTVCHRRAAALTEPRSPRSRPLGGSLCRLTAGTGVVNNRRSREHLRGDRPSRQRWMRRSSARRLILTWWSVHPCFPAGGAGSGVHGMQSRSAGPAVSTLTIPRSAQRSLDAPAAAASSAVPSCRGCWPSSVGLEAQVSNWCFPRRLRVLALRPWLGRSSSATTSRRGTLLPALFVPRLGNFRAMSATAFRQCRHPGDRVLVGWRAPSGFGQRRPSAGCYS